MLYTLKFRKVVTSLQEVTVDAADYLDALGFANLFATAHDYDSEPLDEDVTEIEVLVDGVEEADADAIATYTREGEEILDSQQEPPDPDDGSDREDQYSDATRTRDDE